MAETKLLKHCDESMIPYLNHMAKSFCLVLMAEFTKGDGPRGKFPTFYLSVRCKPRVMDNFELKKWNSSESLI